MIIFFFLIMLTCRNRNFSECNFCLRMPSFVWECHLWQFWEATLIVPAFYNLCVLAGHVILSIPPCQKKRNKWGKHEGEKGRITWTAVHRNGCLSGNRVSVQNNIPGAQCTQGKPIVGTMSEIWTYLSYILWHCTHCFTEHSVVCVRRSYM